MSLPNSFAAATNATGLQLDQNFAALGALTPIPCTASGANTIVLTANTNTPTVSAYSNYMQFTGVAAQSNTGAATGKIGSLGTLSIYKPSASGPTALVGGEIVAGVAFTLLYDSALNSGSGGFHLMSQPTNQSVGGLTVTTVAVIALASITALSLGGGQTVSHIRSTTSSISWPSLIPSSSSESIVALGGCSVGDNVLIGYPASINSNISYRGYVPNAGSVAIVAQNFSTSTVTPVAGTYRTTAMGF